MTINNYVIKIEQLGTNNTFIFKLELAHEK
ncbi:hypothetical protein CISEMA079M_05310 [Citrobacter sedlakii]